ncbi:MAG TPA: Flp pilus assembly protein CpaB [Candidatus Brocadiia bacterium]|nr:Flp pilus assembly protein CpaB [Candidatus Brocadiia bacterium]
MKNLALVVAIAMGIIAALGVHRIIRKKTSAADRQLASVEVVKARAPIRKGEKIKPEAHLEKGEVAASLFNENYVTWAQSQALADQVAQRDISRGSHVMWWHIMKPEQETSVSPDLKIGERAVTINVDSVSGVAGLLRPGDRVDIYATVTATGEKRAENLKTVRVLSNVTILATDSQTSDVIIARQSGRSYTTVTFALTPEEAGIIIFLHSQGKLVLAKRHALDNKPAPDIVDVSISNALKLAAEAEARRRSRAAAEMKELIKEP